jgi:hypothetical protein
MIVLNTILCIYRASMMRLPVIVKLVEVASITHNNGQRVCVLAFLSLTTPQPFLALQQNR